MSKFPIDKVRDLLMRCDQGPYRVDPQYSSDIQTHDGSVEIATVVFPGSPYPSSPKKANNAQLLALSWEMAAELDRLYGLIDNGYYKADVRDE